MKALPTILLLLSLGLGGCGKLKFDQDLLYGSWHKADGDSTYELKFLENDQYISCTHDFITSPMVCSDKASFTLDGRKLTFENTVSQSYVYKIKKLSKDQLVLKSGDIEIEYSR